MDRNNKNKQDSEDVPREEQQLINEIQLTLHKKYSYSLNQIANRIPIGSDSQKIADLVVFDDNKLPIIIVEITRSRSILPLSEHQLRELLLESKANFGLLYNGTEKRAYQKIGNSLVQIKDIPRRKLSEKGSTTSTEFRSFILPEREFWRMAENVRSYNKDYHPLLQVIALKILDEVQFKGRLFESYYTNPFDDNEVTKLLEIGIQHFPELFASSRHLSDDKARLLRLFDSIKNFSLQKSNLETITKIILKLSSYKSDWLDFPDELLSFMLELLLISKNKKILVPYAGLGYCFDIIQDLKKEFKLTKHSFNRYVKDYFVITEGNLLRAEILRMISLIRGESFPILTKDFLQLDEEYLENFEYIFSIPPFGTEVYDQKTINYTLGNYGKQLVNHVLAKLLAQKAKSRLILLVYQGFLFQQDSSSIRYSILKPSFLRGIIELPAGLLLLLPAGLPLL